MKIGGKQVTKNYEILVLPRSDGDLVIKAESVSINSEFEKLCPPAVPPMVTTKEGSRPDFSDSTYKKIERGRDAKRFAFMILRSIAPSEIEWENVKMDDPSTWENWQKEMEDAGLSEVEITRVINCVLEANSLDESKIKAAREAFLRGQGA